MKNRKSIFLLLVLLLGLVVLHVTLNFKAGSATTILRRLLARRAIDATAVSIVREGHSAVELVRTEGWHLVRPYAGNVDESRVLCLLDALAQAPIEDMLTDVELLKLGRTRADFALDPAQLSVSFAVEGKSSETISFGALTPARTSVYVAISNIGAVFTVSTNVLSSINLTANDFRRRSVFLSVVPDDVNEIELRGATRVPLTLVRGDDRWHINGKRASVEKVNGILTKCMQAEAANFVWPVGATNEATLISGALLAAYGLDGESSVSITLTGNGRTQRVVLGNVAQAGFVYALAQDGAALVTVPAELKEMALQSAAEYVDARLFPLDAAHVTSFSIVTSGVTCVCSRDAASGWCLESPVVAPADVKVASSILSRLLALTSADVVESGLTVAVSTNTTPVAVVPQRVLGSFRFEDLRSRDVLQIDPVAVHRFVATDWQGQADAVVIGRERAAWNVEKSAHVGSALEVNIRALLDLLKSLKAVRVEKLKVEASDLEHYGLEKPWLSLAIDLSREGSVRRNLLIGAETQGGRYATIGSSDAIFVLSAHDIAILARPLVGN